MVEVMLYNAAMVAAITFVVGCAIGYAWGRQDGQLSMTPKCVHCGDPLKRVEARPIDDTAPPAAAWYCPWPYYGKPCYPGPYYYVGSLLDSSVHPSQPRKARIPGEL